MKERKLCKNTKKASEAPATIASKPKREKVTLCVVKPKILPNTYIEIQTRTCHTLQKSSKIISKYFNSLGIPVYVDFNHPRKGCMVVRMTKDGLSKEILSFLDMPIPFQELRDFDLLGFMDEVSKTFC